MVIFVFYILSYYIDIVNILGIISTFCTYILIYTYKKKKISVYINSTHFTVKFTCIRNSKGFFFFFFSTIRSFNMSFSKLEPAGMKVYNIQLMLDVVLIYIDEFN
jgi:hypothetical protein